MSLLSDENLKKNLVIKTELTRKLTVDGKTIAFPVYRVDLSLLFYNDQNDRIATWISEYKSKNGQTELLSLPRADYNSIIENFIIQSNPEALKKTQTNIELLEQREPGVVLIDGRIIDGNRRYACLRRLSEKNTKFNYFETVILEKDTENNEKQIKMLELSIQHGEDAKVDYTPIDRLVGVYTDIIEKKLLSISEYERSSGFPENEIKKMLEIANLMIEFLEFINAPKQFHIARDLAIYFPLEELQKLLCKTKDVNEKENIKNSIFSNILMQPSGDMTRFIRKFKDIIASEYCTDFLDEQIEIAEKVVESLPAIVTEKMIREDIRTKTEITNEMERSIEKATNKVKKTETRNRPYELIKKATETIADIDKNILLKLDTNDLKKLSAQIEILESEVYQLKQEIHIE